MDSVVSVCVCAQVFIACLKAVLGNVVVVVGVIAVALEVNNDNSNNIL